MSSYSSDRFKDHTWGGSWKSKDSGDTGYTPWWKRHERKRYTSRLGFDEEEHKKSYSYSYGGYYGYGKYSSYLDEKKEDKTLEVERLEILKVAFNNSRDLVNILEFPYRINIYYDSSGYSRNHKTHDLSIKERNIYINTINCLEEIIRSSSSITPENKEKCVQVISGNSLHEAAHMKFTSLTPVKTYFGGLDIIGCSTGKLIAPRVDNALYRIFTGMGFSKLEVVDDEENIPNAIMYTIFSYLEDERVDTSLLEERNGWFNYMYDYKEYCYNKLFKSSKVKSWKVDKNSVSLVEFFLNLVKMIRYQDKIDEDILNKYLPSFEKVKEYLNPKSTVESIQNTFSIFKEIILPIWNACAKRVDISELSNYLEKTSYEHITLPATEIYNLKDIISISQKDTNTLIGSDQEDVFDLTIINHNLLSSIVFSGDRNTKLNTAALDIITEEIDGDYKKNIYFYKPLGNLNLYNKEREEISKYIPVMRNMVRSVNKDFDFTIHGQRAGKLDTTKLAEAYQGVPQVYVKKGITRTSGMNICVVVDESGSMTYRDKDCLARKAAILLNEAFGFINGVDLYLYGHSADEISGVDKSTEIFIYREPGYRGTGKPGCGCSEIHGRRENRDGVALEAIAKRIRTFTKQPVLMFVISDGSPSAKGYWGESAIIDTKNKVDQIEKMGFYVIQVTIDSDCVDASQMFKNYVDITKQVSELPQVLGGMVRNQIVKILQNNTSTTTI